MAKVSKEVMSGSTRNLTTEQRRERFLKAKAAVKNDWRTVEANSEETFYPYGYLTLDSVLGFRGMTHGGRVVHIHGNEYAGKTTITTGICANYQKLTGEPIVYLDFENTLPSTYFRSIGVDEEMAMLRKPKGIQDACNIVLDFMDAGVRLFAFDSIPRMKTIFDTKTIRKGDAFKASYGRHAKAISEFYDVMLPHAMENDCSFIMINQQRDRIEEGTDAAQAAKYPSFTNLPYILPGGRANRYNASVMLELKTKKAYRAGGFTENPFTLEPGKNEGNFVATQVRARSLKNKVTGGGFREGFIWHRPGKGVDENISVRQLAYDYNLINYVGRSWVVGKNPDEAIKVYNNKEEAIQALVIDQDQEVLDRLRSLLITTIAEDELAETRFQTEVTAEEAKYLKGESDEVDFGSFDISDDDELDD